MPRQSVQPFPALLLAVVLAIPSATQAQGLPEFGPLNPVASSRSGLYFQPFLEPQTGHWRHAMALDYASVIEYNRLDQADYVLDSEVMRLSFAASRDLGRRTFLALSASVGGVYAGFLDGFLDWYHARLGFRMSERDDRPRDQFLYSIVLPDGRTFNRARPDLFLGDVRAGLGFRITPQLQAVFSVTLPTSTGPEGYGKGVPSAAVLNTLKAPVSPRLMYEGSVGVGVTPTHGRLSDHQTTTMLAVSSGLRHRLWGNQSLYGNLFYHSPYYHDTSLPALDRRELSLDFGGTLQTASGGEWRVGMTEDLEPGGPGVDLVFRLGRTF
ncbi:MAG: DUF3187 family protein [Gemmatimonadales bacterium]